LSDQNILEYVYLHLSIQLPMYKRLVRREKKLFGVCGGLGHYFDTDPVIFRIIFVIALLIFGTGLLVYLIMALVMPDGEK